MCAVFLPWNQQELWPKHLLVVYMFTQYRIKNCNQVGTVMRLFRYFIFSILLITGVVCLGQSEDWLPISDQDRQFKDVPGNPGASAVRLYYAHYIDDNSTSEFFYERIKILNEKALNPDEDGKTYADVEIPVLNVVGVPYGINLIIRMVDLKARTIHPDGSIVEFNGKVFEKIRYKGREGKLSYKAFSMPSVTVGSIVEYKYRLTYESRIESDIYFNFKIFSSGAWIMQRELYTVKEHLHYRPYEGGVGQSTAGPQYQWSGRQVSRVSFNLKEKPKSRGNESDIELHDVPAFQSEDYMPPENNFKPSVVFFYSRKGIGSSEKEWQDVGKEWGDYLEEKLGKNGGVKEAAIQAIGGESDPGQKLRKLYQRAQKVRNLSYERPRTEEELKKENLHTNIGVGDVLSHGYGTDEDITLLFVALARAAGFDADVVQASDRKNRFFSKDWTSLLQVETMMAVVNLNGTDIFLEPGNKFCPYGLVRWNHTETDALKLDKKAITFVKPPTANYDRSVTKRTAQLSLSKDGTLTGTVTLELQGQEALESRLDGVDRDEAGRKKSLEEDLKGLLPAGAIVKATEIKGWDEIEGPLVVTFSLEVPAYAAVAGKLLMVPACVFQTRHNKAFTHADRKYPIYFPYPFTESDSASIEVPAGFTVESVPQQQDVSLKYARYQSVAQFDGARLITQRRLAFNGIFVPLEKYAELKDFFSKVKAGDEQQAVLHGGGVNAQKVN